MMLMTLAYAVTAFRSFDEMNHIIFKSMTSSDLNVIYKVAAWLGTDN